MGWLWIIGSLAYMLGMGIMGFSQGSILCLPIGAVIGFACGFNLNPEDARYFAKEDGWRYFASTYLVYLALSLILYGIGFVMGWVARL